jgi:hypothetical protein
MECYEVVSQAAINMLNTRLPFEIVDKIIAKCWEQWEDEIRAEANRLRHISKKRKIMQAFRPLF